MYEIVYNQLVDNAPASALVLNAKTEAQACAYFGGVMPGIVRLNQIATITNIEEKHSWRVTDPAEGWPGWIVIRFLIDFSFDYYEDIKCYVVRTGEDDWERAYPGDVLYLDNNDILRIWKPKHEISRIIE